jgi:hypothetical protein
MLAAPRSKEWSEGGLRNGCKMLDQQLRTGERGHREARGASDFLAQIVAKRDGGTYDLFLLARVIRFQGVWQ